MKRYVALTAAVACAFVVTPATGASARASLTWSSCGIAAFPNLQCATVGVPLDHQRPDGPKLRLTISRAAHTGSPGPRKVLLVNPGGPGTSGLAMAGSVWGALPENLRATYDVVGFDPRGAGKSEPVMSCQPTYFQGPRPDFVPTSPADEEGWVARTKAYADACAAKYPDILPHMRTVDTARDMDDIRAALGQDKISFLGFSYGSYLGAVYGNLFPRRLDRMIFDSGVGPDGLSYAAQFDQDRGFYASSEAFFAWIARYEANYHLGGDRATVSRAYYDLRARLRDAPALGGVFGPDELDVTYMGSGYSTPAWPALAQALSDYINEGDSAALAKMYATWGPNPANDNFNAVLNAVRCTDQPYPRDYARWHRDGSRVYRKAPFNTWTNLWFAAPCLSWPVPAPKPFTIRPSSAMPRVLMFQATGDPATPYAGGVRMHHRLDSRLVTQDGGMSHGVTQRGDACADAVLNAYLETGALPRADMSCPAPPLPVPAS